MAAQIMVLTQHGTWVTDCTAAPQEAQERAKFLIPRVPAVKVLTATGQQVRLVGA